VLEGRLVQERLERERAWNSGAACICCASTGAAWPASGWRSARGGVRPRVKSNGEVSVELHRWLEVFSARARANGYRVPGSD